METSLSSSTRSRALQKVWLFGFYYPIVRLCICLAHFMHDHVLALVNTVD